MNKRELRARYRDIDTDKGSTGRNVYVCTYGHYTLAEHLDIKRPPKPVRGKAPAVIICPCCQKRLPAHLHGSKVIRATSLMYNVSQKGVLVDGKGREIRPNAKGYLFRPSLSWCLGNYTVLKNIVDYVLTGGLMFHIDPKDVK